MSTQEMQISFPKTDTGSTALAIPTQPTAPVSTGLEKAIEASPAEARKTLSCKDLLFGETLTQAEADADRLYADMKKNSQVFMTYGTDALEGVNSLTDRLLHDVEPTNVPELEELMKGLNKEMRGVKNKYDISDPDVYKKYEKMSGRVKKWWRRGKTMFELLMEDITSLEHQLDKVSDTLRDKQYQLVRNVSYYDEMYEENDEEIGKVIYRIAVMELINGKAANEATSIKIGDATMGDRGAEQQAALTDFVREMNTKISEYKGRLFVAWATSPQVRTMRSLNVGLAERLNELICVTIPTMKGVIVQWRMLMQSQDGAQLGKITSDATNAWMQEFARSSSVAVPMIADAIETPTLTPATITAMADSISKQAEGIITAMEAGVKRRADIDAAIVDAQKVMTDASKHLSDATIENVVKQATQPLQIATSVH